MDGCRRRLGLRRNSGVVAVLACRAAAFAKAASALTIWAVQKELPRIKNFIDGEFVEPVGGKYLDNIEPATGKPYSQVADSGKADVDLAVAAAEAAFGDWSKKPAAERSKILLRIADLIERDLEKLSRAESIDTGKPLSLARSLDIPRAASNFRFFATAILHTENEAHITTALHSTTRCASRAAWRG